jgi:hypothetical protein
MISLAALMGGEPAAADRVGRHGYVEYRVRIDPVPRRELRRDIERLRAGRAQM